MSYHIIGLSYNVLAHKFSEYWYRYVIMVGHLPLLHSAGDPWTQVETW